MEPSISPPQSSQLVPNLKSSTQITSDQGSTIDKADSNEGSTNIKDNEPIISSSSSSLNNSQVIATSPPKDIVIDYIYSISDPQSPSIKISLFKLNNYLKEESNILSFCGKNGLSQLEKCISALNGNTLNQSFQCLLNIASNQKTIKFLNEKLMESIIDKLYNVGIKSNIIRTILSILSHYQRYDQKQFYFIIGYFNNDDQKFLHRLVSLLKSNDLDLQIISMRLVNGILEFAVDPNHLEQIFGHLEQIDINPILLKLSSSIVKEQRKELLLYQKQLLKSITNQKNLNYENSKTQYDQLLVTLKDTLFDGQTNQETQTQFQAFESILSYDITGLNNILYFLKTYPNIFKSMFINSLKTEGYSFSTISIFISQLLYDTLLEEKPDSKLIPVLFSHYSFYEELFSLSIQIFDNSWSELNSTIDDIPKLIAMVRKNLLEIFRTKKTIFEAINSLKFIKGDGSPSLASSKRLTYHQSEQSFLTTNKSTELYSLISKNVQINLREIFKYQKTNILQKGLFFKIINTTEKSLKSKVGGGGNNNNNSGNNYLFIKLSNDQQDFLYAYCTEISEITNFIGSININDVQISKTNPDMNGLKIDKEKKTKLTSQQQQNTPNNSGSGNFIYLTIPTIVNSNQLVSSNGIASFVGGCIGQTNTHNMESVEIVDNYFELTSINKEDMAHLIDGHRLLTNKPLEHMVTIEEFNLLEMIEINLLTLDLQGVEISSQPPVVPKPPVDYDFYQNRLDRYVGQQLSSRNSYRFSSVTKPINSNLPQPPNFVVSNKTPL